MSSGGSSPSPRPTPPVGARSPRRRRRWRGALALAAVAVLALGACDPVTHPTFRTVEPAGGPVRLLGLSGDGNYAVVTATGAGVTVPGAGYWRVDRRDGSVVQLPAASWINRISDDGQRVLFTDSTNTQRIWNAGTVVTPPLGTFLSRDLRWGVAVDPFVYQARRWELATGGLTAVEAGHPRPAEYPTIWYEDRILGVSDDGNVVWFPLRGDAGCITRFINVADGRVDDFPYCADLVVAANGSTHLRLLDGLWSSNPLVDVGGPTRLELVDTRTHAVRRTLTPATPGAWFDGVVLADTGWVFWTVETTAQGTFPPDCGTIHQPQCTGTITAREAVAASPTETARFPVDADLARYDKDDALRFSVGGGGRFVTYATYVGGDPVHVLDRLSGLDESLTPPAGVTKPSVASISTDGRVVAYTDATTSTWAGWFEHEAAPPAP